MSDGHYPEDKIVKYLPLQSKVVCLLDSMKNMKTTFQQQGFIVQCKGLDEINTIKTNSPSVNIAFLTDKDKVSYIEKLYATDEPFILIMPTSCLGLTGLGKYFREKGISFHIIPETIMCRREGVSKMFKPPYTLSLYSWKCVPTFRLEII